MNEIISLKGMIEKVLTLSSEMNGVRLKLLNLCPNAV